MAFQFGACRKPRIEIGVVGALAGAVDDNVQASIRIRTGDHKIVEDAALVIEQHGEPLAPDAKFLHFAGNERFKRCGGGFVIGRDNHRLAHMRNIKQPGLGAGVEMLFHHAHRVLHRHVVAGERDHLCAKLQMERVKRGLF